MFHDLKQTPSGAAPIRADLCIIGSGPAGLTLAQELLDSPQQVVILESGDSGRTDWGDDLNRGIIGGVLNQPTEGVRARQVGGTANHWIVQMAGGHENGFRFVPMQDRDFRSWPIGASDLHRYYAKVHERFELGPMAYDRPQQWQGDTAGPTLSSDTIRTAAFSFCSTRPFTTLIPAAIERHDRVHLYRDATACELEVDPTGRRVTAVRVKSSDGVARRVEAGCFVLANGGFGVPQLLLNSRSALHPAGIGNAHDRVGRCYMDHSLIRHGHFAFTPALADKLRFYDMRVVNGVSVIGSIGLRDEVKDREHLRGVETMLFPRPAERNSRALDSLHEVVAAVKERKPIWRDAMLHAGRLLAGLPYLLHFGWKRLVSGSMMLLPGLGIGGWSLLDAEDLKSRYRHVEMVSTVEHSPDPKNRVSLSSYTDALGVPRIRVHLDFVPGDLESVARSEELLVADLQRQGFGRFTSYRKADGGFTFYTPTSHHLMGTARMGASPEDSVVDAECRVHGMDNLYIASSAVFRTGGYANPTMTTLALALRLADTLKRVPPAG
jgi:choline dehydrogenase-like flavoprotein